jgi:ABC-type multidrug transport system fused ATPase/permease subunit
MRASLTPAVFLKSLSLPTYVREELSLTEAKLTTLIQVDIDKVCAFLSDAIHPLWLGPFNLVVLAVLLFFYIGVAYLPSFFCMVALLPFNATLATKIQAASKKMMAAKDKRLQIMSEAIGSIESMKMLGLEDAVEALSNKYREEELLYLKKLKMFAATREFAVLGILFMCTNLTFGVAIGLGIRFNVGQVSCASW